MVKVTGILKFGAKVVPIAVGFLIFGNPNIIPLTPVIVDQILGVVIIIGGFMALTRKK